MVRVITISDIKKLIAKVGLQNFFCQLIDELDKQYGRWELFEKSARHAVHLDQGVIELMPICDDEFYTFKYVNGHPGNTKLNKLTVVALGLLSDKKTGYPMMISEMTLLTALRTAATSALAAKYLAKKDSKTIGIIGTGAQSEFQVLAQKAVFDIKTVKYFDLDSHAMKKFHHNLRDTGLELIACTDGPSVIENVDIITTATASKKQAQIIHANNIYPGLHINGIGGDSPGKTELDETILSKAKVVVEFFPQSKIEGEIQNSSQPIYAELWEIVTGKKKGRESNQEITLFDSVGFAIEDFAVLKLIHALAEKYHVGTTMDLIPDLEHPKDLFGLLQ
jgi:ornithine cyclodeaminase